MTEERELRRIRVLLEELLAIERDRQARGQVVFAASEVQMLLRALMLHKDFEAP